MATFYKGDEVKFLLDITAQGFSMDDDDFEVEVRVGKKSVKGYKTPAQDDPNDLVIYRETTGQDGNETTSAWYAILDTSKLEAGDMRVIATAHIVDEHANDGVRNATAVAALGRLTNP